MADSPTTKQSPTKTATTPDSKKSFVFSSPSSSPFGTRKSMAVVYCFTFFFIACIIIIFFNNPSNSHSSIWFTNIHKTRSQFSAIFSRLFPDTTHDSSPRDSLRRSQNFPFPFSREIDGFSRKTNSSLKGNNKRSSSANNTKLSGNQIMGSNRPKKGESEKEKSSVKFSQENDGFSGKTNSLSSGSNQTSSAAPKSLTSDNQVLGLNSSVKGHSEKSQYVKSESKKGSTNKNVMVNSLSDSVKNVTMKRVVSTNATGTEGVKEKIMVPNHTSLLKKQSNGTNGVPMTAQRPANMFDLLRHCDIFDGSWVRDDSYPLYPSGSCPCIDEPFDCFRNGRGDNGYEKFRWQPKSCNIPRLNGRDMLDLLRGKRLVYVGDSLNRNMWESMVCTLRSSVKDKSRVFEASGRQEFRTEHSYSFLFTDYNCSVEFFRSTFLVQEWEMPDLNGLKKETLRLDLIERSSDRYKSADIIVFNTGHWWTHEKTSQGKGYYQEGSHVYGELNVVEAFRKAMTTWARWIDANINPTKTLVFFRGYSASHFSGGQWNSGGQCDSETEPIKNEAYLSQYPSIMSMLERVMKGMETPVFYLNVTKMTDFRKDAHPSIYRK
ncbi:Protein trichome birefringence like [Actinidia chinensis var. chinensis]|uniref:Protein trichome birefringence like n=1 Tax=Actinidia chinensis var. chinensis TaxID=1590841 RepID=A0A2R6PFS2_ACTCC|nr:Protein trichome birefringence like [Actinidia chinensis var. chinensis]